MPGEEFDIVVDGLRFTVKALTGAEQMELAKIMEGVADAEAGYGIDAVVRNAKSALDYIFGVDRADELWSSTVDGRRAMDIARSVMSRTSLDEDEVKNSESPH